MKKKINKGCLYCKHYKKWSNSEPECFAHGTRYPQSDENEDFTCKFFDKKGFFD